MDLHLLLFASLLALAHSASIILPAVNFSRESNETWLPSRNATHRLWISQIMADVLPDFFPWSSTNEECTKQGIMYKNDLANLTLWAVQMLDASAVSEIGLLSGNEFMAGNFDQCIHINVPERNIVGKHCLANMKFNPTYYNIYEPQGIPEYKRLSPMGSVWDKIRRVNDDRIKKRDRFYWAICIPSACTHSDLQESLSSVLVPVFKQRGVQIELTVGELDCEVGNFTWDFTPGAYAFMLITAAFVLIVLGATLFHVVNSESYAEEKEDSNVLLFFSIISNSQRLMKPDPRQEFQFLSGIKVLSMFLIIYGHRMLISMYWPLFNVENQEKMFDTFLEIINLNGPIIVNTFLLATGFLIFNKLIKDMRKGRQINIPLYIFYRWARATPVYIFVLCFFIFVKPLVNNDPLYKREAEWRVDTCTQNFWSYILYVNNYYKPHTECLLPAWYLAVDMQLYIVCVITGYIMSKSRKIGYALLFFLLGVSVTLPGVITYFKEFDATLRLYLNFLDNYYENDEYVYSYIPTHMRAGPYVVGMLTAVVLMKLRKIGYEFTFFQKLCGVAVAVTLGLGSLLYAWIFYIPERQVSFVENGFYVSLHRLAWSLCISWIILAGVINGYGKISVFLSARLYSPLNKLTLDALLIHPLIQGQTFLMQRQAEYVNFYIILWKTCGDITVTYIASFFLHIIIEAPLARLQDYGLRKMFGKKAEK